MATPLPKNAATFSLAGIMACTGGRVQGALGEKAMQVCGISTDTRSIQAGEAFVALAGEQFDGHEHLGEAAARGAVLAFVERKVPRPDGMTIIEVGSTLEALGALASCHLARWREADSSRRVLALTGSAGKTTTKTAISGLLRRAQPHGVHTTPGNLNNLIGAPLTVLALTDQRDAVLELGSNSPGEIPRLARMVRPNVALVTLVASAHTEGLGDLESIAREKLALLSELSGADSVAMGNADDDVVMAGMMRCNAPRRVSYGEASHAVYRMTERSMSSPQRQHLVVERGGDTLSIQTPLIGQVGALATTAAIAAVEMLIGESIDPAIVGPALDATSCGGRLCPVDAGSGLLLIDDSYNANPASCAASLQTAVEIASALGRRLVVVFGEMRELGGQSADEHVTLGRLVADSSAALLIAVEGDAQLTADAARSGGTEAHFVATAQDAVALALSEVVSEDVVLVKGSRGVRTETVVQALLAQHDARPISGSPPADGCRGMAP